MMIKSKLAIRLALLVLAAHALPARADDPLQILRPGHPRLMVLDEDFARLKELIKTDPTAKQYFDRIHAAGDQILTQPVSERIIVGPRLLTISRQVFVRTSILGGLYHLTGDRRYAARCRDEMLAAARFKDWNPSHFLDVAEMTNGLAVGYDWIFETLTDAERTEIQQAIVEKGLKPGLKVYATKNGWNKRTNNWNQVCNGGLTVGALAIADVEPEISRQVIEAARASIPIAMAQFAPDGGCVEGPGYWGYATQFNVYYLAALRTALGTDFGLMSTPGFSETGTFRMQSIGPIGKTFNFADAHDGVGDAPQMFWFARAFDRPAYAAHERDLIRRNITGISAFHLFWYNPAGTDQDLKQITPGALYKRIDVAYLRTGWDAGAAFVGFKGGDNAVSHAHCDLGEFVYDAAGVRWAADIGPDDYNLPGYFGGQRWNYYRLRTEGQNSLTIDSPNQDPKGTAKVTAFSTDAGKRFAEVDLSKAYGQSVRHATRRVELRDDGTLLVSDDVHADQPVEVIWHLHTAAKIDISPDAKSATLTHSGKQLTARIVEPSGAQFATAESDTPPSVESTVPTGRPRKPGVKLVARLPEKVKDLRLIIELTPPRD